ncbi:DUF2777 family protein [Halalkalibacter alkalisediminis]|uniref:DUF2777 family protein n=1 Tax=Halalkalibacter alkalisediminis TaxID=935616 RepID=A0ABV6NII6_9BACI|nr:DUF2777 family protein [Halalkalibacter alkalisediminis]
MDRKKAQSLIGKFIKVDDGVAGCYIAILKEINAEPRKPWKGVVQIKAVLMLPAINESNNQDRLLPYKEDQIIEFDGAKLSADCKQETPESYENSLVKSAQVFMNNLQAEQLLLEEKEKTVLSYFEDIGIDLHAIQSEDDENGEFIIYTFHHDGDRYILIDDQDERLDLQDCPFKISWKHKDQVITGIYESNGTFLSDNGVRYTPKEGAVFIIAKEQFDPYVILLNELEPTALASLEKNLAHHQLQHDDLVECHNSLLTQLLDGDGQKSFKGVNFLTYNGADGIVHVQHHYERELHRYKNDKVYDRFEFTTEQGKRSIVTYTNEYSH